MSNVYYQYDHDKDNILKVGECQEKCVSFWVRLNFHTSALGFGTWN